VVIEVVVLVAFVYPERWLKEQGKGKGFPLQA
jgi:hypothetical protein